MSKYYIAACLYIFGMLVYVFWMFTDEDCQKQLREFLKTSPAGPKLTCFVVTVLALLFSVTWPYGLVHDAVLRIKKRS